MTQSELALVEQDWSSKHGTTSHDGPHPITEMNDDGAVQVQMNDACDTVNVRQLKPTNLNIKIISLSLELNCGREYNRPNAHGCWPQQTDSIGT